MKEARPLKTVWVLGAGFSRAVGGPLLSQLLSASSADDLAIRYEDPRLSGVVAETVRRLFQSGLPSLQGVLPASGGGSLLPQNLWRDAEEFVEYLDAAAADPGGPIAIRLERMLAQLRSMLTHPLEAAAVSPSVRDVRAAARRIIAAECCSFLVGSDTAAERWDPYHAWADSLRENDTIVTFNYDRVVENLSTFVNRLAIAPPGGHWPADACRVLKLHGSVDWIRLRNGTKFQEAPNPEFAVVADDEQIAIATPGPTKRGAAKEFAELWSMACAALSAADVIVFVGYRFPPSDAEARTRLLGAIRENNAKSKHLRVNVVLGPERTPDVIRLEQMLRAVCKSARLEMSRSDAKSGAWVPEIAASFEVATHAMWAEDFFTVWSRGMIE